MPGETYPKGSNWVGDVLERLFAEVFEVEIAVLAQLLAHNSRDTDPARFRQPLDACRNIDPIPVDSIAFRGDVAEMHSDAKVHPSRFGESEVACFQHALDFDRGLDRVLGGGKLR